MKWGPWAYNFGLLSPKKSLWILEPSSSSFSQFLFFIIPSFASLASRFYSLFLAPQIIPNQQSRLSTSSSSYYCNSLIISINHLLPHPLITLYQPSPFSKL